MAGRWTRLLMAGVVMAGVAAVGSAPAAARVDEGTVDSFVIGGEPADEAWGSVVVQILFDTGSGTGLCSGSFLDREWILTAAHCVGDRAEVLYGAVDETNLISAGSASGLAHPYYSSVNTPFDFGLYLLDNPVPASAINVLPLASFDDPWSWAVGLPTYSVGWGLVGVPDEVSPLLQIGFMEVLSDSTCTTQFYDGVFDPTTQLCTYAPDVSTCSGDSGGPVLADDPSGQPTIIGVTSYGPVDCDGVSVAAWIPSALSWIQSTTGISQSPGVAVQTDIEIVRVAGLDRYETASSIGSLWDFTDTVFVTTGSNFPDALAAGAAASRFESPVLLVNKTFIPQSTRFEIERLAPDTIYVAGGTAAIDESVLVELARIAGSRVVRLGGQDRYETARQFTNLAWSGVADGPLWVASGRSFQDPLIASAAAAVYGEPFVLVDGQRAIPTATLDLIRRLDPTYISVIGAPGSFTAEVLNALSGVADVQLFDDVDVSDRSASVWYALDDSPWASLATANNFPDALTAVAFSAIEPVSPLMLVTGNCVPLAVTSEIDRLRVESLAIFGGPSAVSASVESLRTC